MLRSIVTTVPYVVKSVLHPSLLLPWRDYDSIVDIDIKELQRAGIKAVCFDKDNCLTLPLREEMHPTIHDKWEQFLRLLGPENIIIVSNSAGSPRDPKMVQAEQLESLLRVHVLRHDLYKPLCGQDIIDHFKTVQKEQILVIGDRRWTDVIMANMYGFKSILVPPIDSSADHILVRIARKLEDYFAKLTQYTLAFFGKFGSTRSDHSAPK